MRTAWDTFQKLYKTSKEFRDAWEEDIVLSDDNYVQEAFKLVEKVDKEKLDETRASLRDIVFYEDNNHCYVEDFILDIENGKLQEKILRDMKLLDDVGPNAEMPLSRHIKDGIFELRTKQGSNATRIFYFFFHGSKIIMTNGYVKKRQDLDTNEFELAQKRQNDYLNRSKR